MKSKFLYLSASLVLLSVSFRFNETEVDWLWQDRIQVPIILISTSVVLLITHFYIRRKGYGG